MSETFEVAGHTFTMETISVVRAECSECEDSEMFPIGPNMQRDIKDWAEVHLAAHGPDVTTEEYIAAGRKYIEGLAGPPAES